MCNIPDEIYYEWDSTFIGPRRFYLVFRYRNRDYEDRALYDCEEDAKKARDQWREAKSRAETDREYAEEFFPL